MSYQDRIALVTSRVKRKLFDYRVFVTGTESKVIRFTVTENRYRDREYILLNSDIIPFALKYPETIPITRMRRASTLAADQEGGDATGVSSVYLYDALPIEGFSMLKSNVMKGDILIKKMRFDHEDKDTNDSLMLVLQVVETLGNFETDYLTWQKHMMAPYTLAIPQEILDAINQYGDAIV